MAGSWPKKALGRPRDDRPFHTSLSFRWFSSRPYSGRDEQTSRRLPLQPARESRGGQEQRQARDLSELSPVPGSPPHGHTRYNASAIPEDGEDPERADASAAFAVSPWGPTRAGRADRGERRGPVPSRSLGCSRPSLTANSRSRPKSFSRWLLHDPRAGPGPGRFLWSNSTKPCRGLRMPLGSLLSRHFKRGVSMWDAQVLKTS
jgi:hypothetical protein